MTNSSFDEAIDVDGYTYKELMRENYRGIIGINKRLDKINGRIDQHDKELFKLAEDHKNLGCETNAFHLNTSHRDIIMYKIGGVAVFVLVVIGAVSDILNIF